MNDAVAGSIAVAVYAPHRQHGQRCELDGELWPCYARRHAPGHYQPGLGVVTVDQALQVIARHTELDGHCTACGEEWMCLARREARAVCERAGRQRPAV